MAAIRAATARSSIPHLLGLCPASPRALADPARREILEAVEAEIADGLAGIAGLTVIDQGDFAAYPVDDYHDARRDDLGHIPYTPLFFAALGTLLARRIHALKFPPYKVIALDCDNTLWKGVVGEEGPMGIGIGTPFRELQEFLVGTLNPVSSSASAARTRSRTSSRSSRAARRCP